jgi:tetratricopeptide (TPR) repeat protein
LLALALAFSPVQAQKHTYALDEDPIRLGFKALDAGRRADARAEFLRAIADDHQVHRAKFGLAEIAAREGRLGEAESLYREAVALRSEARDGYPEASAGLGLLLLRTGRDREAEQEFARALAADDRLWPAHYGMARVLLLHDRPQEAKQHLDLGAGRKGVAEGEDLYQHGMALYYLSSQDLESAERAALLALHLNPADPDNGELVGRIYEQRDAPALAIDAYEKALAAPGLTPTAPMLHGIGALCQKVGRFNDSKDYYLRAVAADSTYAPALRDLARLYRLAGQHEQAARVYLRYVTLVPDDGDALLDLSDSCYKIGRFAEGANAARTARSLKPDGLDAAFALARCGIRAPEKALRDEAAALMTTLPDSLHWQAQDIVHLAAWLSEAGKLDEAQAQLERAIAINREDPDAYFQLGMIKLRRGHAREAIELLAQAAGLNPSAPAYRINLGIARFQVGDYRGAIPEFKSALALNPELVVGHLLLAQAYAVSDSITQAKEQYERVLDAEPANPKALRGLGFCYVRRAHYKDAVAAYQRATEADPQDADGWAGLGNANLGLAQLGAARAAYERARALDPNNAAMKKGLELLEQAEGSQAPDG